MDLKHLKLCDSPSGCRLALRVRAGARRERIAGIHGEALKVAVSAPPERGRANRAVVELLAGMLGLPAGRVRMVAGERSPDKIVLVEGLSSRELKQRLAALV